MHGTFAVIVGVTLGKAELTDQSEHGCKVRPEFEVAEFALCTSCDVCQSLELLSFSTHRWSLPFL